MARVAATIIETAPGSGEYIPFQTGGNIGDMKDALKALPEGNQKAIILSTSGVLKRKRVTYTLGGAKPPARKPRAKGSKG